MSNVRLSGRLYSILGHMWAMTSLAALGWATLQVMIRGFRGTPRVDSQTFPLMEHREVMIIKFNFRLCVRNLGMFSDAELDPLTLALEF